MLTFLPTHWGVSVLGVFLHFLISKQCSIRQVNLHTEKGLLRSNSGLSQLSPAHWTF